MVPEFSSGTKSLKQFAMVLMVAHKILPIVVKEKIALKENQKFVNIRALHLYVDGTVHMCHVIFTSS